MKLPKRISGPFALGAIFFLYVAITRTYGLSDTTQYLADQVRDWRIAFGSWRDLPLIGPHSFAGGNTFGPVYYWFLWLTDLVIGPFTNHLPHAGGYGQALLQAAADTWLFVALRQRLPTELALATALLIATAPFDVGVSASIRNTPVATAFVKMTMAFALTTAASPSLWRIAGLTTLGWFAVQSHSTAILVIGPLFAALVVQPMMERRWRRAFETLRVVVEIMALLQIPYVIHALRNTGPSIAPAIAIDTMATVSSDLIRGGLPTTVSRVARGLQTIGFGAQEWSDETSAILVIAIMVSMVAVVVRWWRQPIVLAITIAPFLGAVAVFLPWRNRHMYAYWFETSLPSMFLGLAFGIAAIPWRAVVRVAGVVALVIVLALLPLRFRQSQKMFRFDWYKPLVAGIQTVVRHTKAIHDIQPAFQTDVVRHLVLVSVRGRTRRQGSDLIAVIQPNGEVIYKKVVAR